MLGPGLQYPPRWVLELPAGTYRNQAGESPDPPVANLVFSRAVRDAAAAYFARLDADLGWSGSPPSVSGPPIPASSATPVPARAPRTGPSTTPRRVAPAGRTVCRAAPLPDWEPGDATWRGEPVTVEHVTSWFRWYADAVVAAIGWQVDVLSTLGFAGDVHLPVAGRGVLPADLADAVDHRFGGADRDGALGRGLDYPAQFPVLARLDAAYRGRLVVDFTGLDDVSAVRARALDPPQDTCRPSDVETVRAGDAGAVLWSAQRWTTANARLVGLPLVGENPGGPDLAHTGGAPDSDSTAEQLRNAPAVRARVRPHAVLLGIRGDVVQRAVRGGNEDLGREVSR